MRKLYFLTVTLLMATLTTWGQTYYQLSSGTFTQYWTNTDLINATNDWLGVASIKGFRGDGLSSSASTNPQTVLADGSATPVNVMANQTNPNTNTTGGIAEFHLANPVVALQGSGTADAPHLVIYLNTTGTNNILVQYKLRDIDGSGDNAVQQVALQYRVGGSGNFTDIPSGYVADASTGPSLATLETAVSVMLPTACEGQGKVELRIITNDATGSDEWVGIDDIVISASAAPTPTVSVSASANGSEPAANGKFTVSLSAPAPVGGVIVNYTISGTATLDSDYSDSQNGTLTISEGSSTGFITLSTKDDNVYEGQETIIVTLSTPINGYVVAGSSATINLEDNEQAPPPTVVISQVYGGGGNNGATFKNDFIELYNYGSDPVNLSGLSVQYASPGGTTWQVTPLSGIIPAKGFFLIQEAAGANDVTPLPKPDATGTIAMGASSGKVVLSTSVTALNGENPAGANVIDKVGYGNATGFETTPAPEISSTTSIIRKSDGIDNNNNFEDFVVGKPAPRNTAYITIPPVLVSLTPPNGQTEVSKLFAPKLTFDKPMQKGTGFITISEPGGSATQIDVSSSAVVVLNNTATINTALASGKTYTIQVGAGVFEDIYTNDYAGFSSEWSFSTYDETTPPSFPVSFDLNNCSVKGGVLTKGFYQYSTTGAQVWDCTVFGRNTSNGLEMNGYDGTKNTTNEDWLISPKLNLSGTAFPLLSFWSRTEFKGQPLQLKISTDYTGGNPSNATWTTINGRFPAEGSGVWTESKDINLAAYKGDNVHIAFVYRSSTENGARWTLDDITIANAATAPAPSFTVAIKELEYGFVSKGATASKSFAFYSNDLTGDVTLTATAPFQVSKDGVSFSSSITYSKAEANDVELTAWVQFAPDVKGQEFTGTVTITSANATPHIIQTKGNSIDPVTTLEVVNWNVEWFGSSEQDPGDDNLQEANVTTVLKNLNADIYALAEVVSETRLKSVVDKMPGYAYVISDFGSHTNTSKNPPTALGTAQKLAFVYNTSVVKKLNTRALLSAGINEPGDLTNPNYEAWASGRFPFMMEAEVNLNCITKNVRFILVHAKANTAPIEESYNRRRDGANALHDSLQIIFPNDNVVILGDFNDDLDQSITDGFTTSSWNIFTEDATEYSALTLPLSEAGRKSTASYNDVIDHVVVSKEMAQYYMNHTANIRSDVEELLRNYSSTTSDHYPVITRYRFEEPLPVINAVPAITMCASETNSYTIEPVTVHAPCGNSQVSYLITGATSRSGNGLNASGEFEIGVSTITWTATDGQGNTSTYQTTVTVNATPSVTISDAYALPNGTLANTVYTGYSPAASLTLGAVATGGQPAYSYSWSNGATTATTTANPTTATTYQVTVTDANGCTATDEQLVNVVDVRAGRNKEKVLVCHQYDKKQNSLEVEQADVALHLAHGDMLGSCESEQPGLKPHLMVGAQPNPSALAFTLSFRGGNPTLPIQLKVTDIAGRLIETRANLRTEGIYTLGSAYGRGIYFVEVMHDGQRQTLKLIKQ